MNMGYRKLTVVLLAMLGAFLVSVTPEQVDLLRAIVVVFVGGNAVEHITKAWKR